jgi:hypothetical protein
MCEFLRGAFRHPPLLVTGVNEGQVLLSIVVESKRAIIGDIMFHFFIPLAAWSTYPGTGFNDVILGLQRLQADVIPNTLRRLKGYTFTSAESHTKLAIVNRLATESRLGNGGVAAVSLYFA